MVRRIRHGSPTQSGDSAPAGKSRQASVVSSRKSPSGGASRSRIPVRPNRRCGSQAQSPHRRPLSPSPRACSRVCELLVPVAISSIALTFRSGSPGLPAIVFTQ